MKTNPSSSLPHTKTTQTALNLSQSNTLQGSTKAHQSKGYSLLIAQYVFSVVSVLAYRNWLPDIRFQRSNIQYPINAIQRDQLACIVTFLAASIFVKVCSLAAKRNILSSRDTRKIIHSFSAPFFLSCWPLFSNTPQSRFFAGAIMIVFNCRLWMAGSTKSEADKNDLDLGEESELANAVSRSGDAKEAIGGPFLYGLNVFLGTILFWRTNLIGILAITIMAAGDGVSLLFILTHLYIILGPSSLIIHLYFISSLQT